ncbi:LysR family transcriptional regulator [Advenella mimigardefordensis]|uniref:Transcriptional regulator, LysR family n=1 Tax=Advenella mimigardefordensis (strain DSM 17166 / LMG 22922 / DPN7) TaxID=1247726 RepID=W0PGC3_ADVMD|nr:LysR family transcriptional regulator [Advenella mimigardefordensis]AHG64173.1 transcriptional regulator, LysR family [Advenella mimigardefordensis DPN7]
MELRHLRYFIAAAEEEHFGRAADRMCITRPAISQIIADLENELSLTLFERAPGRVKLTAAGRGLLPRLQNIMDELNVSLDMAREMSDGKRGTLRIAYGTLTLLHPIFRAAIKQFRESFPDVTLSLLEMVTSQQSVALAEGKIDAGFMNFGERPVQLPRKWNHGLVAQNHKDLDWLLIQSSGLGVVMPNDHQLAHHSAITLDMLEHERFIVVPQSSGSHGFALLYALCEKAGFEPQVAQEVTSISSQLNLVSVGIGIGFTILGKNFYYPDNVTVVPLANVDYHSNFVFAWIKDQRDPVLEHMINIIAALSKKMA